VNQKLVVKRLSKRDSKKERTKDTGRLTKNNIMTVHEKAAQYLILPITEIGRRRRTKSGTDVIKNVERARSIVYEWLDHYQLKIYIKLGLPEFDDRRNVWRVPLLTSKNGDTETIGEIVIDAGTAKITQHTNVEILRSRIAKFDANGNDQKVITVLPSKSRHQPHPPFVPNKVVLGDAAECLSDLPPNSVQLVFTSPPYYNAKPEYTEYLDYQEYLNLLRRVFLRCHEVMSEGRFFIINVSPILIRRPSRQFASRRIAVPFDVHGVLSSIGFEFIDDIIWVKPEGAGWATGRGRRFAADRNPLQYKPVPVTEYILVYRKKTPKLIDWNIRTHHDPKLVKRSRINGIYDVTNVWYIPPGHHKDHPAVFPDQLVEKVIRYYSFIGDMVLDPFAGSGTLGRVALKMDRRFFLIDNEPKYFVVMFKELSKMARILGKEVSFEPEDLSEIEITNNPNQPDLFKH